MFWYQSNTGFIEWVFSINSSSILWTSLRSTGINYSLNVW
jgi:hypothetical protein